MLNREAIKEDEDGLVESLVAEFAQKAARKAAAPRRGPVRLGMMRHLLVAIDCSDAMNSQDLKPSRFLCTLKVSWILIIQKSSYFTYNSKKCFATARREGVDCIAYYG